MALKIAMIGAGSIGFTRRLMRRILTVPELADTTFAFTDISAREPGHGDPALPPRHRSQRAARAKSTPRPTGAPRIADADYVICMIRQGGLEAFQTDIDIPLKYGVDQCVGDTICAGGHHVCPAHHPGPARLLPGHPRGRQAGRAVPELLQPDGDEHLGVQQIRRRADHRPLPRRAGRALADRALHRAVGQARGADRRRTRSCTARDVDVIFAGINHQTWCIKVAVARHGHDPAPAARCSRRIRSIRQTEKVRHRRAASASATTAPNRTAT